MRPLAEQQLREYLNRLSVAARVRLAADDRRAFLARTRNFIEQQATALQGDGATDISAVVSAVLQALGEPENLAERERERLLALRAEGASANPRLRAPVAYEERLEDFRLASYKLSQTVGKIDLARCHVTGIREQGSIETFLSEERKTYRNSSKSATLTKEIDISNCLARTVTIEAGKLRAHNAQAGITLLGFGSIQGQLQQQLNQRYSVAVQTSITINEKTTIQIPPNSVVEHVIQWRS